MHEFASRVEKRWSFSNKEIGRLLITSLISAFSITLVRGWSVKEAVEGSDEFLRWGIFELVRGLSVVDYFANLMIIFIALFIFLLVHFSVQKLVALRMGYSSEYKYWVNGMIIGVIMCFFTYGYLPLFFPGALYYDIIPKLRMGVFRGGVKHKDLGLIAFAGPLTNIILVGLIAPLYLATKSQFFFSLVVLNLLIALWSLLPIPTFEKLRQFQGGTTGLYIFIASRWIYIFVLASVIGFAALILLFKIFSYLLALAIGIVVAIIYYSSFEMK
ncbi:hypothetical protein JXB28_04075 [Candidatus Woesearchaeota archaeon]|nr:hypothetical protein [Candidatus Woesearchaeota archaeon]